MESIEELIKQSRGVLGLLERCQPFLQSSKSRSEYCEDSAKPMRRSIDILEEIKKKKFVINIAFFSTKPGVGKSFIINALTTNQSGAPATSSSQMGGNGVTSIPTRYRYGKTKRYTRYYLDKEQIEERISLYRKYHSELDLSYQEKYSSGPLQQDLTSDLLDSEDFFLQVQNIQKKTSHTDQFFTLYDEVIYPFPLMEEADMKYSLLDLPGYRDGKSEFRFCQLYACLKYCDIHTVAGIAYGTAGRGRPEPADLQLLLALHCFESQFTATPHPPNYMHLLNTINNNEDDYNEERLKELINDALVDVFGLATQQTEKVNSNDIDEIATRANRNLAALENRYSLYQNILEHSMAHVFYKVDNAPNADHVERWNNSVISDIKGYVAETQQQILCHQALVILSELSVPLKYRVKTGNTSLEKKMKARMKHFTNLVILQKKGITGKLKEIMDSSKDEYDTETGDDTAAFNTLYNLITHLMVDITESLAKVTADSIIHFLLIFTFTCLLGHSIQWLQQISAV
ncbi:hypothetical protein BKA69DRAFT_1101403 [Paraphysoderma sedebokerense]|nr:hypothetical protein BKA69DRAFT_1101403 [Paraphysoderma sedebokerense]